MAFTAILDANIAKFSKAINTAQAQMDRLEVGINAKVTKLGNSFSDLGQKASLFSAAYVTGLGLSVKSTIDFESAFAGVEKTVRGTTSQLETLRKGILDMSKQLPTSASEIAKVAEAAGQLGIETDSILTFSKTMIDLGEATNLSSEMAATALARFANITQMSQSDFDRLGSVISALGNTLATTEAEIVDMGLRLAGAGTQIGLTEAQILSLAGALSSVGIEAQAGGSAFSRVMVDMQLAVETGSKRLNDFANISGMTAEQFRKSFQEDAAGAIISFIEGLANAEKRGQSAIAVLDNMGITEIRLRDALLRASGASDLFRDSIQQGTIAWEENIALTQEAEKRYNTRASKFRIMINKLQTAMMKMGEILLPIFDDLVENIGRLVDWFSRLDPVIIRIGLAIGALAAAVGPLLLVLGGVLKTIPLITVALSAMAGPIGWVVAGVTALTIGIAAFSSRTKDATSAAEAFSQAQDQANKDIAEEISELNKLLGIAKNESLSKDTRIKAIEKLNALSPQYLGGLKLESINTAATTIAVEQYTKALADNARQKAVSNKLTELHTKLLKEQENILIQQQRAEGAGAEVRRFAEEEIDRINRNIQAIGEQIKYYESLVNTTNEGSKQIVSDIQSVVEEIENISSATVETETTSIGAFEKLIGTTLPLRDAIELTSRTIEQLKSKLIDLQTGVLPVENVKKEIEETQQQISDLSSALDTLTGNREINIDVNVNKKTVSDFLKSDFFGGKDLTLPEIDGTPFVASLQKVNESVIDYSNLIGSGIVSLADSIGNAFGSGDFSNLGSEVIDAMGRFAQQFGSLLIAAGLASDKLKTLITNPWSAIAAGAALVALGSAASAMAQKMVNNTTSGGSVGGTGSYRNIPVEPTPSIRQGPYQDFGTQTVVFKIGTNELVGVLDQYNSRKTRMG